MKTFNRLCATLTAGLLAATLALTAASFVGADLDHDDAVARAEVSRTVSRG